MSNRTITLKPGFLVALSTRVEGGVKYGRKPIDDKEQAAADVAISVTDENDVSAWQTVKVVEDPVEHGDAIKVRSKVRSLVTGVCITSPFGLLCPSAKLADLDRVVDEARTLAATFNDKAKHTRVDVWIIRGQIVESDTDAVRAISAEIRGLLDEMGQGIKDRDVATIRAAAAKAKSLGGMLDGEVAGKVRKAVEEARAAAREIVKTVEDRGSAAEVILIADTKKGIEEARFAFLDLDVPEVRAAGEAMAPTVARDVDLGDGDPEPTPDDVDASRAVDRDVAEYSKAADGADGGALAGDLPPPDADGFML